MQSYITQTDLRREHAAVLGSYSPQEREQAECDDAHGLTAPGSIIYDEDTGAPIVVLAVVRVV